MHEIFKDEKTPCKKHLPLATHIIYYNLKFSINTYKAIALVSFLILIGVQFFLVYNTYKLENEHYYVAEKNAINELYSISIRNDKVFPGGAAILDHYINGNMKELERVYKYDNKKFEALKQKVCDSAFMEMRTNNKMDSVMADIFKKSNVKNPLKYSSTIQRIDVTFHNNKYISLYNKAIFYPLIDSAIQTSDGILIAGNLQNRNAQNLITPLSVSSAADYSYRITFMLYAEPANRRLDILKGMLPTFLLSFFSILSVVFIFYITFKNWVRQKKLSEMKSDFINSITHEFHTPLAAIIVANKTMQTDKIINSKESLLPLTEVITRQSERLKILIGQVLDITTMNQIVLDKKEYSLHELLDDLLLDYRLKLTDSNVMLQLIKEAEKDTVELDKFWFTTVLLNIFDNALKYNNKECKQLTVTTYNDKKNVLINIVDNGIGMTQETQKHIFDKFYRHTNTLNGEVKGLGLGLFYVKQAIDAHNWTIDIQSNAGEGSIFIISINYK